MTTSYKKNLQYAEDDGKDRKKNMIRTRVRTDGLKESSSSTLFPSHN